jgi:transcription initiation factor IIE alpha subunit
MLKFLIDVLQIAIVLRLIYAGVKWILFRKNRKNHKSMLVKVWMLISRRIHHNLNSRLTQQTEAFQSEKTAKTSEGKVIPLRRKTT